MHTFKYKQGHINVNFIGKNKIIKVNVDNFAYCIQVKSVHAAKILITKHAKRIKK